jgi:hypothetical protein
LACSAATLPDTPRPPAARATIADMIIFDIIIIS